MQNNKKLFLSDVLQKNGNNFDLLRLIAAFAVLIGHAYALAPQPPLQDGVLTLLHFDYSGSLAVKFFFFLSGLLVTESIIKRPEPIKFLARRVFRIFPGLILCLLVAIFIIGPAYTTLTLHAYFAQLNTWTYFVNNIGLFHLQWKLDSVLDQSKYGLNGSLWTLQYEVLCYLYIAIFCGLGVFLNRIAANVIFVGIIAAAFIAPQYLPHFAQNPESFLLPACFSMGVLLSYNKNLIVIDFERVALFWLLVIVVDEPTTRIFLFYIALFYTSLFLASRQFTIRRLKLPFDASYGVYVYGFMIQQCLRYSLPHLGVHGNQFYAMIITLLIGAVSWHFIEKPALAYGAKLTANTWSARLFYDYMRAVTRQHFNDLDKNNSSAKWKELFSLLLISVIVHALVLKFIFPGYYSPLWPNHSDYYLPAAIANSSDSIWSLLRWPRPVGMVFFALIGTAGIRGSVALIILVTLLNCVLSAMLLRKIARIEFKLPFLFAFVLYLFLLFSQVNFYGFYSQDAFAQLSYLFLICAAWVFCQFHSRSPSIANLLLFVFCLMAFLAKETYGVTAIFVAAGWFFYARKDSIVRAASPVFVVGFALLLSLAYSALINSIFINVLGPETSSPYKPNFNPSSIIFEWLRYARDGLNIMDIVLLILVSAVTYFYVSRDRKNILIVTVSCFIAGLAAWIPNSLLPNHYFSGYSWSGAYVLYLPVLLVPAIVAFKSRQAQWLRLVAAIVMLSVVVYPIHYKQQYAGKEWMLMQEHTQRNLMTALVDLMNGISTDGSDKILITGLSFPFNPFVHPRSLSNYSKMHYANFNVVDYSSNPKSVRTDLVKFIAPEDVVLTNYSQIWLFADDGQLIRTLNSKSSVIEPALGLEAKDWVVFPEVAAILGLDSTMHISPEKMDDGLLLLQCGNALMEYHQFKLALQFFEASAQKIPNNPYPSFGAGVASEDLNQFDAAKHYFENAVRLDTNGSNPTFGDALKRSNLHSVH